MEHEVQIYDWNQFNFPHLLFIFAPLIFFLYSRTFCWQIKKYISKQLHGKNYRPGHAYRAAGKDGRPIVFAGLLPGMLLPEAGVLEKLSLAGLAKLSRLRNSWLRFGLAHWIKKVICNGHGYRQSHWVMLTVTVCILFCSRWECAWVHFKGGSLRGNFLTGR